MPAEIHRRKASHVADLHADFGDLNLLDAAAIEELHGAVESVPDDVSVLTLGGGNPDDPEGLTAGIDLTEAREFSAREARAFLRSLHGALEAVRDLDAVTVCGCGTYALGAGLELAMACDFRVATADATLGLPEVDVGLVTGIEGGLLVRLVGLQAAKELIYTAEPVSGTRAAELGLVNRAAPADEYGAAMEALVGTLAAKSPLVLRWQKGVFRAWRSVGIERGIEHSLETIAACFDTHDAREAMDAFLEKRDPEFEGR